MVRYSFFDILRNFISLIYTKLFYSKARLIRLPFYRSGSKFIYSLGMTLGRGCRFDTGVSPECLIIGRDARIGDYVHINADKSVVIGNNVLMASKIFISDTNHGTYQGENQSPPSSNPTMREYSYKPVRIGDNVWIGENVVILPGTSVGNGCIIGANSVLTGKKYPDNAIIAGVPAKVIKVYNNITNTWDRIK